MNENFCGSSSGTITVILTMLILFLIGLKLILGRSDNTTNGSINVQNVIDVWGNLHEEVEEELAEVTPFSCNRKMSLY